MNSVENKLKILEKILIEQKAPVCSYFNAGVPESHIVEELNSLGMGENGDFVDLYKWHNGIEFPPEGVLSSHIEIFPFATFFSLNYAKQKREEFIKWGIMDNAHLYLPFMGSGEDDAYLLKNEIKGTVYCLSPASNIYGEPFFNSIEGLIDFVLECYNEKILYNDQNEGLIVKDEYFTKWESRREKFI